MKDRNQRIVLVAAMVAAFVIGGAVRAHLAPSQPERPFLKFIAKVAKFGMWFLLLAESEQPAPNYGAVDDDHISHARSL